MIQLPIVARLKKPCVLLLLGAMKIAAIFVLFMGLVVIPMAFWRHKRHSRHMGSTGTK